MENQEPEDKTQDAESEDTKSNVQLSTQIVKVYLTGRLLGAFVPYLGISLVIGILAWAIKMVLEASQQ